ncbi:MAG: Crp/Fnr family transcriptional regulator [Rubrivivax sp. SCN 70-15]|nr:MAG: Crp/Fnr family transcriptional regulator [Rubrivivax sp. SCN 70-15]
MKVTTADPRANRLLAALPDAEWQRWQAELEGVRMPLGEVLHESGRTLAHVYFPTTAIVSLLYVMENGASAEIAVVGNEGVVGISLFMGGESTPSRGVVQSAGQGLRLRSQYIKDEFNRAGAVMHLLLRYTQPLIANMLGVRREGVIEAALELQKLGLIRYARGHISVLDRAGLEARGCECYAVVKKECDRLLPQRLAI